MAFDQLILGPYEFQVWGTPEKMPLGGTQKVDVKNLPGGGRVVDVMGPVDHDPAWEGTLFGPSAVSDMLTLDQLRKNGQELAFSWGCENRTVVITEFEGKLVKANVVEYSIKLVYTDDSSTPDSGFMSIDTMVVGDLSAALSSLLS